LVAAASRPIVALVVVCLLLIALPVVVWLDLTNISERTLQIQANAFDRVMDSIRKFYSTNVVAPVLASTEKVKVVSDYHSIPNSIPLPATLSLELGNIISEEQGNVIYRFISDYPFGKRPPHRFDDFERQALVTLRRDPNARVSTVTGSLFQSRYRLVAPILMEEQCVACHNSHPDSPKRDWAVGDVRGIQEIVIEQSIADNLFSFKYLLLYFIFGTVAGGAFIGLQRLQGRRLKMMNNELQSVNSYLQTISTNIAKYLSPQLYRSIFRGEKDVELSTERKKLTIFFSDIVDFTKITERLQPEELTAQLNEYLTQMSDIALHHGGTIDKFIGDAFMAFFGDPETKGVAEDAKACLCMAIDMQRRLTALNVGWQDRGLTQPLRVRMGINTGYCNVGNFGSADRMDYTIIGGEANLAARLQSIAEPGSIVISAETYALVRDIVDARPLPPIFVKGISREISPYLVRGLSDSVSTVLSEHAAGLDFYFDPSAIDAGSQERIRAVLARAIAALDGKHAGESRVAHADVDGERVAN
jgi:adenylate/guanylate cyclase